MRTQSMIESSGAYDRDSYCGMEDKRGKCEGHCHFDKYQDKLLIRGITEADKKDLVHWMAYREKRPPSPTPDSILEKMKSSNAESDGTKIDRFVERECTEKLFILNM